MLVLYFPFSSSSRVYTDLSPSLPNKFSIIQTLSLFCVLIIEHKNILCLHLEAAHFLIFLAPFESNVGCLSAGPPNLGIVFIGMVLLTELSAYPPVIILALVASIAACFIAFVMLCSVAIFVFFFFRLPCVSLSVFYNLVSLVWDFLPFTPDLMWFHSHSRMIMTLVAPDYVICLVWLLYIWLYKYKSTCI